MKILHLVNNSGRIGGVETYVYDLLPELASFSHENFLIYRWEHSKPPTNGIKTSYQVPDTANPISDQRKIVQYIDAVRPDVGYLHDIYDPKLILEISRIIPTVGYVHIFYPVCPGLGKLFHRGDTICERPFGVSCVPMIYLRRCSNARNPNNVFKIMRDTNDYLKVYRQLPRVIVGSQYMQQLLIQNKIQPGSIEILPPHFIHPNEHNRSSDETGRDILFVGRLEYEKGIPYLLKAMLSIPEPYSLKVVGNGTLMNSYREFTNRLGLSERVRFEGWLTGKTLEQAYKQSCVVVIPSIMPEPYGKVGIEAMNYGKPVVAFNSGGISDWLMDGFNGYLVPVKDIHGLASCTVQLMENKELRVSMGQNGRKFIESKLLIKDHIERLINIFQQAVQVWTPN